jgi:hypothetical protein
MFASKDDGVRHCTLSTKKQRAGIIDVSLTVFISGVVVLEVLLVLVTMAVLIVPVLVAVLDVLVVTGSSGLRTNTIATTTMTATNPKNKSLIIANFPHLIEQPTSAYFSSPLESPSSS